jgi:hypothetical protein
MRVVAQRPRADRRGAHAERAGSSSAIDGAASARASFTSFLFLYPRPPGNPLNREAITGRLPRRLRTT